MNVKKQITHFWNTLQHETYCHNNITRLNISNWINDLTQLLYKRKHLAIIEMPTCLKGKKVLEIGCGNGAHSLYFKSIGADLTSIDISCDRVVATKNLCELINGIHATKQMDAESLEFENDTFDIIYSNGVLHHTPDTVKAISECYRVLKKNGQFVIMLYAKHSFLYWFNLYFCKGILMGRMFKEKNWLSKSTEWLPKTKQKVFNPVTKVYTKKDIMNILPQFHDITVRKNAFIFDQIPFMGKIISKLISLFYGENSAGELLYGRPWRNETKIELILGEKIGFGLNIKAVK